MRTGRGSLTALAGRRPAMAGSVVAGIGIIAAAFLPGLVTGLASGIPDVGNAGVFELDGNIAQDTPSPPPYDWTCVFNTPAGHTGCPPSANPADPTTTPTFLGSVFKQDFATPDSSYFTSNGAGVKDINDITQWGCTTLNNPLSKDDILNAYGAVFLAPTNDTSNPAKSGDELLYLAEERASNNGDSFAGFWLMHRQHACDLAAGSFTNGGHDNGDLLVVSNYTNGGTNPTIQLYVWDSSVTNNLKLLASGFTCGAASPPPGLVHPDDICGIASTQPFTEPWAPHQLLDSNQFVEVGIDLTDLIKQGVFPPPTGANAGCFNDFLAETRSSQQTTATLKDFTTGQFTFCVSPKLTTKQTAGTHTAPALTVARGTSVTDQAFLGAPIAGTPAGSVTYNLFSSADCSGQPLFTSTKQLSNGTVPPSDPVSTTNLAIGTYQWQANYSGDTGSGGKNFPAQSTCGDEPLTIVDANIMITPLTKVNEVGNQHTFTVTVNALAPTGQTVSFANIGTALATLLGPAATVVSNSCATPVVVGYQATCTVVIDSATTATYTLNATDVVTINGVQIMRTTAPDGSLAGPGGSGPATKNYVDAAVAIGPPTATNTVGAPHTFTVTVTAFPGNASPTVFNSITPTVVPAPSTMSTTCASPTINGNVATCTVTITSTSVGTFTANVTTDVTMGGVMVTRTTAPGGNAGPGGSGPAVKIYEQPSIIIAPSAVNQVGQPHVFTITVTSLPGQTTVFNSITPHVVPAPDQMGTDCNAPTIVANVATCHVTIVNNTAGVFTATATAVMTINGFQTSVSTDGVGADSGPATKTYVDASVAIAPSAVNEVGHQHVFTVTVHAYPAGSPLHVNSIIPSLSPTAGLTVNTSTCGAPVVTGDMATCTITINSLTAGTYTANAAVDVSVLGVEMTRTTAPDGSHAGPNGSGPAVKNYVDAAVAIGPPTAVNAVGAPHTFTITVTAIPAGATPTVFNSITPSVAPAPTTMTTTCGSPTINGNVATCTLTITSNHTGTFIANAAAMVTMGGVAVNRTTAPDGSHAGPGGSGPATKVYGQPFITIQPSAVNEVGHLHVFTITVTSLTGQTTVFNSITPSVVPAPDQMSTTCGSPTINGAVATCTVTITNFTAGVFTASATAVLTVNGFQTTVSTDALGADSGPATKTFVDASVGILPSAVNEVGHQHVFTVTVHAYPAGSPLLVNSITPTVTPSSGLTMDTSTCGAPSIVGDTATCTVTINSLTAGTYVANASVDVTVLGVEMTRTTAPAGASAGPNGTGPATKNYVDAAVGIGLTAVNPIGQQHVFTIVVTALPGGTGTPVFNSITPSVSPAPSSMSTDCNTPVISGNQATCHLTINSTLPDTFVANATAVVTMGGVQVTRTTAPDGSLAGPGGTGPATKTYVSANIGISPLNATDPVGDLHTLTATVITNNGSGTGQPQPAPNGTVVDFTIVSGPGSLASPSCTISNGLGTCTDVLTSSVAGTTVVQATTTVVVDGVTLRRSTNDSVPGDSVNAVKNWFKLQPAITTVQSAGGTVGVSVSDGATVSGGLNPTGTVTFALFGPNDPTCSGTPIFISSGQPLSGGQASSASFKPTATGTYEWVATYSGDAGNLTAVSTCGSEPVTIVAAAVLGISTPNTGAGAFAALVQGLALILVGGGLLAFGVSNRRRRQQ